MMSLLPDVTGLHLFLIHICPSDVFFSKCLPSQIPSTLLEVRSFCRFLLLYWKSGPFVVLEIRSLCIWKRLVGFQESIKILIPLTGLLIDLSSCQTKTSLLKMQLCKRQKIWKKMFWWIFNGQANLVFHGKFKFMLCQWPGFHD